MAPDVCTRLLGDPSSRSTKEWRWGRKGSFRLRIDTGTWNDFESGEGGGVITLIMREARLDKAGALKWLEQQGFMRKQDNRALRNNLLSRGNYTVPFRKLRTQSDGIKTAQQNQNETLHWIRNQILPVEDAPGHPIRAWMRRRNLWRPQVPLPPSLRWMPADAPVFRDSHSGAGAIAFPLAPIAAWRESYPMTPTPTAVQLVCINADGDRADYRNSQGNRVDKPKFGNAKLAVWAIGDIRGDATSVCEGAADAIALAARDADAVIASLTTPRPARLWRDALSIFDRVTLWPDMDDIDEQGRRPGLDSVIALAQARQLAGQSVNVMGVDIGKDAADAAREAPLGDINTEELQKFALELQAEGLSEFEAFRYASTLLK